MPFRRRAVADSGDSFEVSSISCFGNCSRDSGQRRVPEPPARMTGRMRGRSGAGTGRRWVSSVGSGIGGQPVVYASARALRSWAGSSKRSGTAAGAVRRRCGRPAGSCRRTAHPVRDTARMPCGIRSVCRTPGAARNVHRSAASGHAASAAVSARSSRCSSVSPSRHFARQYLVDHDVRIDVVAGQEPCVGRDFRHVAVAHGGVDVQCARVLAVDV